MPRVLAPDYIYSKSMDDSINDYVTTPHTPSHQNEPLQLQEQQHYNTSALTSSALTTCPTNAGDGNAQETTAQKVQEQLIHTISSSDEEEFIGEEFTNMSSEGSGDFEGFDDATTPNSNGLINDISRDEFNCSQRQCFHKYQKQFEGLEAIEVEDDDDEEIAIGEDGKVIYMSGMEITPKKSQTYGHSYTPNKRKKYEIDRIYSEITPTRLKTPTDQVVEVNSDSTTNSLKQKRQQINNKFQLNFCKQQNHKANNNPNKCSTESTSEFPVSSPSNPQQPRCGKYPPRPPLLKNTLPSDSFERQLAMITACNPQMTLAEKIQSWACDEELSDVEDVNKFDEEFKRLEKQKRIQMKQKEKTGCAKKITIKNFDLFRQMILNNIKDQKIQKYNTGQSGGIVGGVSAAKCVDTSGSESSKSVVHVDDKPSTSAVAQQQLQQRRSKAQLCAEIGEYKKRAAKDIHKRNQNSTTPPQTSSSDNERECFKISKNNISQRQINIHDKLICRSSSEEPISQDVPTHVLLKSNKKIAQKYVAKKPPARPLPTGVNISENSTLQKNTRVITGEDIDSVFRLHRLNRERDKYNRPQLNEVEEQKSTSIIQMRFDFTKENQTELLIEKKQELFKTPIIPQKYLSNSSITAEYQIQNNILPTKNVTNDEEFKVESLVTNPLYKMEEVNKEVESDKNKIKCGIDDLDGVYHQQHEFCNYLGLTGMSTATAMANAVAELAQCNLARRSMRVFRQQQQERRDKSAREERLVEAQKLKQLKGIRKQEENCNITPMIEKEHATVINTEEGSHSQVSEHTLALKKASNNSTKKSSIKSQTSIKIGKKRFRPKALSCIDAEKKEDAEQIYPTSKKNSQSISESLLRQAKHRLPEQLTYTSKGTQDYVSDTDTDSKIFKTIKKEKTERISSLEKENIRILRSSILSADVSSLKDTKSRSQSIFKSKELVQYQEIPVAFKLESACDTGSVTKSIDTKCASPFLTINNICKDENVNEHPKVDELSIFNSDGHFIVSTPNIIQKKLQMALEESRKSKPSIFIVQSLEIKKDKLNNLNMKCSVSSKNSEPAITSSPKINKIPEANIELKTPHTKFNKNVERKVFKAHKGKKYSSHSISKRKLRKRKLIVIKSLKTKNKSYDSLHTIKRELRSSPKINEHIRKHAAVKKKENNKEKLGLEKMSNNNDAKSYRTVHTETKDLEVYLNEHNYQTKTRLMAKASALLGRSKRMTLRGSCTLVNNKCKLSPKMKLSNHNSQGAETQILKSKPSNAPTERKTNIIPAKVQELQSAKLIATTQTASKTNTFPTLNSLETENVVVSSTTNTYDERPPNEALAPQSPITLKPLLNAPPYIIASSPVKTKDQITQCNISTGIRYLNTPPLPTQHMRNPLKSEHGGVLYIYHELDILIVIQERLVSFWKCSKLINMLINQNKLVPLATHQVAQHSEHSMENCSRNQLGYPASSSTPIDQNDYGKWNQLGELRRLNFDCEISVPYANRICLHNSTPIYLEMRAQQLPKNQRDYNLLSMYINIYYYHDEDMIAKCSSIPLDSIQSDIESINYTTLIDSRYFIMTWRQENILGKTRSGLCKYSLTPQLDTLASIREFKSMRHTIRYLECMSDDKLIGFGETQVSIWDYRSGDVLMNFDLEIPLGKNLGSVYFSNQDIEQTNMLIMHQFRDSAINSPPQLLSVACTVTHNQPSYRVLQEINLPMPAFKDIKNAIKTVDHLVVIGQNDDELWISLNNPRLMTIIPKTQNSKRFYSREKSQLIEYTEETLNVNSLTNHILQLAVGLNLN